MQGDRENMDSLILINTTNAGRREIWTHTY